MHRDWVYSGKWEEKKENAKEARKITDERNLFSSRLPSSLPMPPPSVPLALRAVKVK